MNHYLECEETNDGISWIRFPKSGVFTGGSALKCGEAALRLPTPLVSYERPASVSACFKRGSLTSPI